MALCVTYRTLINNKRRVVCFRAMSTSDNENDDLFYHHAQLFYNKRRDGIVSGDKCVSCFMTKAMCICAKVQAEFSVATSKIKSDISIFMHYKEWGRASNTGKLLSIGMPDKANISIFGDKEQENDMLNSFEGKPVLILYPSPSARPISEYVDWFKTVPSVTLCVLDATWSQSCAMNNRIPEHIPRVRIDDEVLGPSLFLNRKQSKTATKVSTVEAVAMALTALGEEDAALEPVHNALKIGVDAVLQQSGKQAAYGNKMLSKYHVVERPDHCPHCGASSTDTVFKNLGMQQSQKPHVKRTPGSDDFVSGGEIALDKCAGHRVGTNDSDDNDSVTEKSTDEYHRKFKCTNCGSFFPVKVASQSKMCELI